MYNIIENISNTSVGSCHVKHTEIYSILFRSSEKILQVELHQVFHFLFSLNLDVEREILKLFFISKAKCITINFLWESTENYRCNLKQIRFRVYSCTGINTTVSLIISDSFSRKARINCCCCTKNKFTGIYLLPLAILSVNISRTA